jgi:hypothetical protein
VDRWKERQEANEDDDEVDPVPRIRKVGVAADDVHGDHFQDHLHETGRVEENALGRDERVARHEAWDDASE